MRVFGRVRREGHDLPVRTLAAVCAILAFAVLLVGALPASPPAALGGALVAGWIVLDLGSPARSARPLALRERVATGIIALVAVALVSVDAGRYLLPAGLGSVVREFLPSARASQGEDATGMS